MTATQLAVPQAPESAPLPRWLWLVAITAAMGPIWLVSRDIWDGAIGRYGMDVRQWQGVHEWLVPGNWGLMYLEFRGLSLLSALSGVPVWVCLKLLLTASVAGIGYEAKRLAEQLPGMTRRDCDAAGLLAIAFPCWYLLQGSTFIYVIFIWWVFLGWRLVYRRGSATVQALGWVLVLCSYQVNSNFVMVFALEGMRWLVAGPPTGRDRWRTLGICTSAVAVYSALRLVFPPVMLYAGYNNIVLPFTAQGLLAWVRAIAMYATLLPLVALPGVAAWLLARRQAPEGAATASRDGGAAWRTWLAIGFLCVGAMFPYIAVGKGPPLFVVQLPDGLLGTAQHMGQNVQDVFYMTFNGWSTRHTFLLALPAALLMARLARRTAAGRTPQGDTHWRVAFGLAFVACIALNLGGHAAKLQRLTQEEALVRGLRAQPPPPDGLVNLVITTPVRWSMTVYEANYLLWLAYGSDRWATAVLQASAPETWNALLSQRDDAVAGKGPSRLYYVMGGLGPAQQCTQVSAALPPGLGAMDWMGDRLGFRPLAPANVERQFTRCLPTPPIRRQ